MENNDIKVYFFPLEEIHDKVQEIFKEEKLFLETIISNADIQHVGGTSIPRSLTKKDVDIQIRVFSTHFNQAVEALKKYYVTKHARLWTDSFAIFKNLDGREMPVDYMLTTIGSVYDNFYKVRDFFIANPNILKKYNDLKKQYEGKSYDKYRLAKNEFFGLNESVRFLNNKIK